MPIRPVNRHFYNAHWRTVIRPRILERSLGLSGFAQCECTGECGLVHGECRCDEVEGFDAKAFKGPVVLTVAHLDQDPANMDESNLRALCQRCHNRLDASTRALNASRTRGKKRVTEEREAGQEVLFESEEWRDY